jgi:three-Cys-motif partner protein
MKQSDLVPYAGREQGFVKHQLLSAYLERFVMILGQHCPRIVYVDAFAGPWESATDDYRDTSFGQAVRIMRACQEQLEAKLHKRVRFDALFIEKNPAAFAKLEVFVAKENGPQFNISALHDDFQNCVTRIAEFIGSDFAFVLIDPLGWKGIISPSVLAPLLKKRRVEVLINYMWKFLSMAVGHQHETAQLSNLKEIFGEELAEAPVAGDPNRECWLLNLYRKRLVESSVASGAERTRSVSFPVQYPGSTTSKYFLVHVTHHDLGVIKFAEASEKAHETQQSVRFCVIQQRREKKTGNGDLFADQDAPAEAGQEALEQPWLELLPVAGCEMCIGQPEMAEMIERNNCFIGELQRGLLNLQKQGVIVNLDMKRARSKNGVNFDKTERLKRLV